VDRYECQPEQGIHKHIVVIANSLIPAMSRWVHCRAAGLLPMTKLRVAGPENSSSAGYRAACFHRSRPVLPAGFSFAFAGHGELLMLLPFKAMLPLGHARKSGGPPLFEPSFKVQRENAHNQSSGFAVAPGS
jgi:hypothetical protein